MDHQGFPHMLPCYQASQRHSLIFSFLITLSLRVHPALRVSALQIWQLPSAGTSTGKSPLSRSKLKKRCLFSRMRKRSWKPQRLHLSHRSASRSVCEAWQSVGIACSSKPLKHFPIDRPIAAWKTLVGNGSANENLATVLSHRKHCTMPQPKCYASSDQDLPHHVLAKPHQ